MKRSGVGIMLLGLLLALAWTATLAAIAYNYGLHSDAGMWAGAIGLPGVVIANAIRSHLSGGSTETVGYFLMFLVNWIFYCSVILGCTSIKRQLWK